MRLPALLVVLLLLGACAKSPEPEALPVVQQQVLLETLAEHRHRYESLEAEAKVRLEIDERRLVGTQLLWVKKPSSIRAEVLNPFGFGPPLLQLASDGKILQAFSPGKGRFYQGDASAANLVRFTRIPLQIADLVSLLLQAVPVLPYEQSRVVTEDRRYRLELLGPGPNRQSFDFDPDLKLLAARYYLDEALQLSVQYAASEDFPGEVILEMPDFKTRVEISYVSSRLNPEIAPARFELSAPQGVEILPIPQ